jgi:lambda family phage portal protein
MKPSSIASAARSIARPSYQLPAGQWKNEKNQRKTGSVVLSQWQQKREHRSAAAGRRSYAGAQFGRTVADWIAQSTSADSELYTSLRTLRNRSRQLVRDNEYAGNAIDRIIPNNVVGQGIGFQAQVMMQRGNRLNEKINDAIELQWKRWTRAETCHTGGKLAFQDIERIIMRSVPESGEILVRMVKQRFGGSKVPFALELIEADQLVENFSGRTGEGGNEVRMGVEVDAWQRPVAYWLYPRHPGDYSMSATPAANTWIRVPAEEILHVGILDRPTQTRCVPWLHNVMVKLRHMGGYEEAEIVRARASASIMGFIQSPEVDTPGAPDDPMGADDVMDGEKVYDLTPGIIKELAPGETFNGFAPTSTNAAMEPFMRFMLRSVAAGTGISYESLSRDYSQSNYSSSRLSLTEDRDNWRILQQWLIRRFHQRVFEAWLEMAVLSGVLNLPSFEATPEIYQCVRWMPRGWDWIDPVKEVAAAKASVRSGFTTVTDVIASKGGDIEDVFRTLRRERDLAEENDLVLETDPAMVDEKGVQQPDPANPATGEPADGAATPPADDTPPGDDS